MNKVKMKTHKDLDVWQLSMELVTDVYLALRSFPLPDQHSLGNQIKKSAISIPSNIAEGAARQHRKEIIQFMYISLGSLSELETQLLLATNVGLCSNLNTELEKIVSIRRMLLNLIKYHKSK